MSTYKQNNQSVQTQFNIGRDQVIHNLVVVGQFLDFAKVEGLLPKSETPSDFSTIVEAFEETFVQRLGSDLTQATAQAGVILSEIMLRYIPSQSPSALPIKTILREVPNLLYLKLEAMGYWNAFYEPAYYLNNESKRSQVVWLYSLGMLWAKHFENKLFGIANTNNYGYLCATNRDDNKGSIYQVNIEEINYERFRIMMAGLTVDIIRMCSIASVDLQFWRSLVSLLGIDKEVSR